MASPFFEYLREFMLSRRYDKRTIDTYLYWIRFFILFHNKRHPNQLGDTEVEQFLSYLSNQRHVAVKTQATALNSLSFLYRHIIQRPLSQDLHFNKSHTPQKLPVVLTRAEVQALLALVDLRYKLLAQLLYGSGLRLMEAIRLRVQDIDFDYLSVLIWQGKGNKNRRVTLAGELVPALYGQISQRYATALGLQRPICCKKQLSGRCQQGLAGGAVFVFQGNDWLINDRLVCRLKCSAGY